MRVKKCYQKRKRGHGGMENEEMREQWQAIRYDAGQRLPHPMDVVQLHA